MVTISEPTILDPASVGDERIRQVLAAPITSDETLDTLAGVFTPTPCGSYRGVTDQVVMTATPRPLSSFPRAPEDAADRNGLPSPVDGTDQPVRGQCWPVRTDDPDAGDVGQPDREVRCKHQPAGVPTLFAPEPRRRRSELRSPRKMIRVFVKRMGSLKCLPDHCYWSWISSVSSLLP